MEKIKINYTTYEIKEESIDLINNLYEKNKGFVDAIIDFLTNKIYIPSEFNNDQFKKALAHELTHAFEAEFITSDNNKQYTSEDLADFVSRYAFKITDIVRDYLLKYKKYEGTISDDHQDIYLQVRSKLI